MNPVIDLYDALDAVGAPSSMQPAMMEKLAAIQQDMAARGLAEVPLPSRRDMHEGASPQSYALRYHTKQGEEGRRYRIDTPEHTALSAASFLQFADQYGPEVTVKTAGAHIVNACGRFGIPIPEKLATYRDGDIFDNYAPPPEAFPPMVKTAAAATVFALPEQGKYPMDTVAQVKDASRYFADHHAALLPPDRPKYARNLVKQAQALGMDGREIAREAIAYSAPYPSPLLKHALDARIRHAMGPTGCSPYGEAIEKFAHAVGHIRQGEVFALTLSGIDRQFSKQAQYTDYFPDPWTAAYYNPSQQPWVKHVPDAEICAKIAMADSNAVTTEALSDALSAVKSNVVGRKPIMRLAMAALPDPKNPGATSPMRSLTNWQGYFS